MSGDSMLRLLGADGPHPDYADKLALFGRLVGAWDVDSTLYSKSGGSTRYRGEWHFGWTLGGRAIQDVLFGQPQDTPSAPLGFGTTVRAYDVESDVWHVVYADPALPEVCTLTARAVGDDIVQTGEWRHTGKPGRWTWTFSEITDASFRWRGEVQDEVGGPWRLVHEMRLRRRPEA